MLLLFIVIKRAVAVVDACKCATTFGAYGCHNNKKYRHRTQMRTQRVIKM